MYDKLVAKVNNIDTSRFLLKTKYDADKLKLEKKIPDTNNLVKKSDYNTKVSEIEGKIPSITGLTTTTALTAVENKIPSVNNFDEYVTTQEFIRLIANLLTKTNFDNKLSDLNRKIVTNKTKHLLTDNELKK